MVSRRNAAAASTAASVDPFIVTLQVANNLLKFGTWVGIGKRMSETEFGEPEIQDGRQRLIFDEKLSSDNKIRPVVFILGENMALCIRPCHMD